MLDHQKEFSEFHKRKYIKAKKNVFLMKTHLEHQEKKVIHARDKEERDRIRALKDNDIDAYINLINT